MGEARNVFSETETTALLRKAKILGVTISQLAQAAHLVALFSQFPAEPTSQVCFTSLLNIRATAGIAVPHYGNATAPFFDTIPCAALGERICKGQVEESNMADATALYNVSLALTQQTQDRQRMALVDAVTVDKFVKQILETPNASAPVPDPPLSVIADGLLERYIQRRYSGKQLELSVEDAHLILQDPCPVVQARTATFGGRLSLSLAYNSHVYERKTVVGMVQCWTDALRYCLREESGRE